MTAAGRRPGVVAGTLATALIAVMAASLLVGDAALGSGDVLAALFGAGDPRHVFIVQDIRLPRILLGALVGASLGLSGAAVQGLLRNPLADPGVVGISASAGLGAVVALYYGIAASFALAVPLFAILFSLAATAVLAWLAGRDASVLTLILAGVAISSLAGALIALAMNLSPNAYLLSDIVLWLLGSLANRSATEVILAGPFMAAGWVLLLAAARHLPALTLGEEAAASLGVDLRRLRLQVIVGAALSVGASVAVSGIVGFVGLVAPHLARPFVGYDPGRLLVPSGLGGALLVVAADLLVRSGQGAAELKLGVVTALLGAPFFLWLVIHTRRTMR